MRTLLSVLALALIVSGNIAAQESVARGAESAAVVKVVQEFFDAMHAKDADRLRATCQPGAQFTSIRPTPEGHPVRSRLVETDITKMTESKEV